MAEATLNDVIARLRADNEKQLREQGDTTKAIEGLSGTIRGLLDYLELQGLRQKEAEAEARRRAATEADRARASATRAEGMDLGFSGIGGMFGGIIGTITSFVAGIGAFSVALVGAIEGLGPSFSNFRFFVSNIAKVFTFPIRLLDNLVVRTFGGMTFAEYITKQFNRIGGLFKRFEFDPNSNRWRNITTGQFGTPGYIQQIVDRFTKFGERVKPFFNVIGDNKIVQGVFKFLRPIAAIFSMFDGLRNASAEMEDREGFFSTYLAGAGGGFIAGTLGSFFGEFANLLRDLPLWVIKQFVPAEWLNDDGTFKRSGEGGNWFTSLLAAVQTIDFNTLIREVIQAPFDAVGGALDFVRNLFGATGTTEEGQAAAREAWNTWWSNWKSIRGIASNVGGILRVLANIAFSPLNAILNQIERAFTGDVTAGVDETFTQKITRYLTQLGEFLIGLIPSIDDLKARIASAVAPNIARALGLGEYLPFTNQAEVENILSSQFERMQDLADRITSINESIAATGDTEGFYATQLETAERDRRILAAETEAILARARSTQGIAPTVVNNFQQQFETMLNPMPSTADSNDSIRR